MTDLHQQNTATAGAGHPVVPLCVDLDGTLVRSDTLKDSLLAMVRQSPLSLLRLPFWVLQGKAAFKAHIAGAVTLDPALLEYNRPLLHFLTAQHAAGRPIYLATASDEKLARSIAAHTGLFTATLASDGSTNLAGEAKLAAFRAHFPQGFSYIGNALPDAPILKACIDPMVANPHRSLLQAMQRLQVTPAQSFLDRSSVLSQLLRAGRLLLSRGPRP